MYNVKPLHMDAMIYKRAERNTIGGYIYKKGKIRRCNTWFQNSKLLNTGISILPSKHDYVLLPYQNSFIIQVVTFGFYPNPLGTGL